jgi:hypothetical protein
MDIPAEHARLRLMLYALMGDKVKPGEGSFG